ncbi:hypothetical protein B484DRAFT_452485 [Ochromonadaceae sp. CCMP2298]|nr:hypothetical protein B484DRAFT_452485 [Ochromonadaceae sp. CCMP2298]
MGGGDPHRGLGEVKDWYYNMGATYLSVGHRPSLLRYHGKKFVLRAGLDPVTVKIEAEAEALLDLAAIE